MPQPGPVLLKLAHLVSCNLDTLHYICFDLALYFMTQLIEKQKHIIAQNYFAI